VLLSTSLLVWKTKYTVCTATPAASAMSAIVVPVYPRSQNSTPAAFVMRSRVACAR